MPLVIFTVVVSWRFFMGYAKYSNEQQYPNLPKLERCIKDNGGDNIETVDKCKALVYTSASNENKDKK